MLQQEYGLDRLFWLDEHWTGYDPLSIPETAARANWYGLTSYPYVRVDGSRAYIGIESCENTCTSLRSLVAMRLGETGGMSPVAITGRFLPGPSEIQIDSVFRLVDPAVLTDLRATLVVVEDSVMQGNETFPRVARSITYQSIVLSQAGDSVMTHTSVSPGPDWVIERTYALVFLQQTSGLKPIIQGALLRGTPAAGDECWPQAASISRIESAAPNPFLGSVEIVLHLTPMAAMGGAQLEIIDPAGRRVREPVGVASRPGTTAWSWNGRDDAGRLVEAGVYFLRLSTMDGVSVRKLIRVR